VFFFDYDGTLTPIVRNPDLAVLEEDMRVLLKEISHIYQVTVISGRDMDDIKRFVNLDSIIYAGSHGFRISGPDGLYMEHEEGRKLLSRLDELETALRSKMEKEIEGIQIERKRYAIAIHYRNVDTKKIPRIIKIVNNMMDSYSEFSKGKGKKILEVKPTADWHKGKAVQWILAELGLSSSGGYLPVYVGDDITDEDAFRTVADEGLGILVGDHGQPTAARYQLKDVKQVKQFLHYVIHAYNITKK
jgi:trehalose-phosphatase